MQYKQLNYDVIGAHIAGIAEHPQIQMNKLGYKILGSVPQSIADCWWFTVEEILEPLPPYLRKMEYSYKYWHEKCWKDCKHFQENNRCCFGGHNCKKETNNDL